MSGGQDRLVRLWNPHKGALIKTYTPAQHGYEILDIQMLELASFLLFWLSDWG
jgi:hypothetical protein